MYNVKSMQASEFIAHDEILETLAYASANKNNAVSYTHLFYCLTAKKPKPCMVSAFAPFITNFKNIVLPGQHHFAFTIAIM